MPNQVEHKVGYKVEYKVECILDAGAVTHDYLNFFYNLSFLGRLKSRNPVNAFNTQGRALIRLMALFENIKSRPALMDVNMVSV